MCDVNIVPGGVQVKPSGWEHAGGLTGEFVMAFSDIVEVSATDDPTSLVHGFRVGVGLPKTKIGTWRHDGVQDYFCVHHNDPAIVIELAPGHTYAKVVVTVDMPDDLAAEIQDAMSTQPNAGS